MRVLAPIVGAATIWLAATEARAAEPAPEVSKAPPAPEPALLAPPAGYARFQGTLAFGGGFRFNNPYRLRTYLGGTAESVSATAPYLDVGFGFALGKPGHVQHGATLRASFGLAGVAEQVFSLTYLALLEVRPRWLLTGRLGTLLAVNPAPNPGFELALGAAFKATAHLGVFAEVVGNLWYGAATFQVPYPVYPVVALQGGLLVDWEKLP